MRGFWAGFSTPTWHPDDGRHCLHCWEDYSL